jgi:hypothetical protein
MGLSSLQINLQHSRKAIYILSGTLTVEQTNITLIEKPWALKTMHKM